MTLSGQTYTCSAGETFDSVSLAVYRDEKYACELLNANPALSRVPNFAGGETLLLPVVEIVEPEDEDDEAVSIPASPPWKE